MSRTFRDVKNKRHPDYRWWDKDPKWWRKIYKHRKRRLSQKLLLRKVEKGELEQIWPLDSKPRIWYW